MVLARMAAHNGRSAALGSARYARASSVPADAKDDPSTYLVGRRGSRHGWLPVGRFDKYLVPTGAVKAAPVAGSEER
jgi:hypothetical protein